MLNIYKNKCICWCKSVISTSDSVPCQIVTLHIFSLWQSADTVKLKVDWLVGEGELFSDWNWWCLAEHEDTRAILPMFAACGVLLCVFWSLLCFLVTLLCLLDILYKLSDFVRLPLGVFESINRDQETGRPIQTYWFMESDQMAS